MIRWSTTAVVVLLALVAGIVSYRHAYAVVTSYGETGLTAVLVPLTVDGLIYASSMVLLLCARRGLAVPALARWALGLGIAATLAANIAHGLDHGPVGAIVAAWPAVALVLGYELLMGVIRAGTAAAERAVVEPAAAVPATGADAVERPAAAERGTDGVPDAAGYVPGALPDELATAAAARFLGEVITGSVPGIRTIKAELGIGQDKARQVRAYLSALASS